MTTHEIPENWDDGVEIGDMVKVKHYFKPLAEIYAADVKVAEVLRDAGGYFDEHTNTYLTLAQALSLSRKKRVHLVRPKASASLKPWPYPAVKSSADAATSFAVRNKMEVETTTYVPQVIELRDAPEKIKNWFLSDDFADLDVEDVWLNFDKLEVIPNYRPTYGLQSLTTQMNERARDRGIDRGLFKSLPYLTKAWAETSLGSVVQQAHEDLINTVNENIRCNGSLQGQLNRLREANLAAIEYGKTRKTIKLDKWNSFMEEAWQLPDKATDPAFLKSYSELFNTELHTILESLKVNLDADAGPVWFRAKNKDVLLQDLLLSKIVADSVADGATIKQLEWARLCKMKPKEEVYSEEDIADERKTRNYFAPTPAVYKPVQFLYYKFLKHSLPGYENQSKHLLGYSPFNGGLNRLLKTALMEGYGWYRVFSDNLYTIAKLPDGRLIWLSVDGKKMESCATKDRLQRFFRLVTDRPGFHKFWNMYCAGFYPDTCIDFAGLLFSQQYHVRGLGSGTLATGIVNTLGMLEFVYHLQQRSKGFNLVETSAPAEGITITVDNKHYAAHPDVLNAMGDAGLKLTLERFTMLDELYKPLPETVYKLDLLGMDAVYLEEVKMFVPVLDRDRLLKALAFKKRHFDENMPEAFPLSVEFSKMRSLWVTGAWYYPGIREIVWQKQLELAAALKTSFVDNNDMVKYLMWIMTEQSEDQEGVFEPMTLQAIQGVISSISGSTGPMSFLSVMFTLAGHEKAVQYFNHIIKTRPNLIPSIVTYSEYKNFISDEDIPEAKGIEEILLDNQESSILLRLKDNSIDDSVEARKQKLLDSMEQYVAVNNFWKVAPAQSNKPAKDIVVPKSKKEAADAIKVVQGKQFATAFEKELADTTMSMLIKGAAMTIQLNKVLFGLDADINVIKKVTKQKVAKETADDVQYGVRTSDLMTSEKVELIETPNPVLVNAFFLHLNAKIPYSNLNALLNAYKGTTKEGRSRLWDKIKFAEKGLTFDQFIGRLGKRMPIVFWLGAEMLKRGIKKGQRVYLPMDTSLNPKDSKGKPQTLTLDQYFEKVMLPSMAVYANKTAAARVLYFVQGTQVVFTDDPKDKGAAFDFLASNESLKRFLFFAPDELRSKSLQGKSWADISDD